MYARRTSLLFCLTLGVYAQEPAPDAFPLPIDRGAAGLWQALHRLHTRASLMMITAHPDDEDGGMLAYESRGQGTRVMLLTLNRGESGANVMSPDFFDALGQVRTQELLAAGRYYGVEQYFTRVVNNGFSKTKEETLKSWSHERVLADAVRVVRATRPLVVTSVFIGGPSDGHGNHQVAGQMAQEVFKAAADPNLFPEQIREGLRPWQPLKVYERIPAARVTEKGVYDYATHHWAPARVFDYVRGEWLSWNLSADVTVPEGSVDPIAGLSYLQIAREGLGFQKSQNGGTGVPAAGEMSSPYHRFASTVQGAGTEQSFFDGIDTSLAGIADLARESRPTFLRERLARINDAVEQAIASFQPADPGRVASVLARGWKETNQLIEQVASSSLTDRERYDVLHELRAKQGQFNAALALALQVTLQGTVADTPRNSRGMFAGFFTPDSFRTAIPGQQFRVNVHVNNSGNTPVDLTQVRLATPEGENWTVTAEAEPAGPLAGNKPKDLGFRVAVPRDAKVTRPYFSRSDVNQGWYEIHNDAYLTRPLTPYPVAAWAKIAYQGVTVEIGQVVQTVRHVNGEGSVMQPLIVVPAISLSVSPGSGIIPLGSSSFTVVANVHSNVKGPAQGKIRFDLPGGWRSEPAAADFHTVKDGDEQRVEFRVFPVQLREQPYSIQAVAEYGGNEYREGFRMTGYEGLRPDLLYRAATYRASAVDVKVAPNLNVGYVMGSGDDVPQAIENLGVHPKLLTASDLASGDLSKFDAILLGVRTYAVREDLKTNNARLLDYVKNGGVVIVQYNTPEFDHNFGPYPYTMTGDPEEVTDEESKMNILAPNNPVFTWPNKISEKDFEGWVSERGSKFMESWDSHYTPLLETHDPEQDPQKGGLLYARFGKGVYIYNAYAFYRQLPEGVPGAYRIMANLISLVKNPNLSTRGKTQ
jgi:LmbE family N-acetylglucosaminyl deacetylase